jgi:trk system potassium uptake protein TrkH
LVILIYAAYALVMLLICVLFGFNDIVNVASFIFSTISTGGFSPVADMKYYATHAPMGYLLLFGMILGASNFMVIAGLFTRKVREFKGRAQEFVHSEVFAFLILSLVSILAVRFLFDGPFYDSAFHVISAMSTTGFSYWSIKDLSPTFKLFLAVLMFIGGSSLSTAGGVKVHRVILFFKAIKKAVHDSLTEQQTKIELFGKEYTDAEVVHSLVIILLMASLIALSVVVLGTYGYGTVDSIVEATSAVTTTGLSTGIVVPSLAIELKWLFIVLMILGRVEIFAVFIMFSRIKEPAKTGHEDDKKATDG